MKAIISALFIASAAIAAVMALPLMSSGSNSSDIVQVAGGCGAGWHRGPYGGCLKNFADPGAHACPRGYHIGPGGACRGNGR